MFLNKGCSKKRYRRKKLAKHDKINNESGKIKTLIVEIEETVEEPVIESKLKSNKTMQIDPVMKVEKKSQIEPALNDNIDVHSDIDTYSDMRQSKKGRSRSTVNRDRVTQKVVKHRHFKKILVASIIVLFFIFAEIGFLMFRASVNKAPQNIAKMKKEIQQLKDENKKIKKSIATGGNYKVKEETKESWERLKEKVAEKQ